MKKMLSLLASMCVALSAVSFTASAQEYEKYPSMSEFGSWEEFYKEISDGIKDGRYFADFDGNGTFNPIDAELLLVYFTYASTLGEGGTIDDIDWNGSTDSILIDGNSYCSDFLDDYEKFEWGDRPAVSVPLSNEMLENVKKYGDVNGNGCINAGDASVLISVYYRGFEKGDVNADNEVSASDASYVLKYYSDKSTGQLVDKYTEWAMSIIGDLNGDGIVDANDATSILSSYSELSVAG